MTNQAVVNKVGATGGHVAVSGGLSPATPFDKPGVRFRNIHATGLLTGFAAMLGVPPPVSGLMRSLRFSFLVGFAPMF